MREAALFASGYQTESWWDSTIEESPWRNLREDLWSSLCSYWVSVGWKLAAGRIVGSSPTLGIDSGKPTIEWEESGAGHELRSLHINVIKM